MKAKLNKSKILYNVKVLYCTLILDYRPNVVNSKPMTIEEVKKKIRSMYKSEKRKVEIIL